MKRLFTFVLSLVLLPFVHAQESSSPFSESWDFPFFQSEMIANQSIRAVYTNSNGTAALRGSGAYKYQKGKSYIFDAKGNITKLIEMEGQDTTRITTYAYTESGLKKEELIEDRSWNKTYKSRYRFTRNKNIYQIKSYEMINEQDAMLLNTHNYIYEGDRLVSIRYFAQNELIGHKDYDYDSQGRLLAAFEYGLNERIEHSVFYTYDNRGRRISIVNEDNTNNGKEAFQYVYDLEGKLIEANWNKNDQLKGRAIYIYDPNGRMIEMQTKMPPQSSGNTLHTVFEYDYYSE